MRICSLLPSATEIIAELGLLDSLVGVSEECRWPPEVVGKPVVTAARIDPSQLVEPRDRPGRARVGRDGRSLYAVDAELIDALAPDLIVTQDLCAVCAVSSGELASACPVGAEVLSLDPRTLDEVAASVAALAARLGVARARRGDRGTQMLGDDRARPPRRCAACRGGASSSPSGSSRRSAPGTGCPEMIELAGGADVLGQAGQPSHSTTWDEVLALEPELVVLGPCGFDAERGGRRARPSLELPCPAVAVDGDAYYSRPAPRLADGVRQLAHLFHPGAAADPGLPEFPLRASAASRG